MENAISAVGLKKVFGDINAVNGVDISVKKGEIYGFLGPNGAGKSTLVKMLTTLVLPTEGSANIVGYDLLSEADDIRLEIGVALQEASLDKKQTGREILSLQGRLYGLSKKDVSTRIKELSSLLDVESLDRKVGTYSGGMERRLDLAASLMHNPSLLFLDEPTTGLDPTSRASVWEEVRRLNTEIGTTIFLTTQYLEEADSLSDRVGIINKGKLVGQGTPQELKKSVGSDVIYVRLDKDLERAESTLQSLDSVSKIESGANGLLVSVDEGASSISAVAVALDKASIPVVELTLRSPTLDDVFLELTGERIEVSE